MVKIKEKRIEKQITQQKLAEILNVSKQTVSGYETGYALPSVDTLIKLADFFGCTTDELLGRENYGTGSVEIIGEKVDEDEKKILGVYRALDKQGKRAFLSMTENLATLHNISLKSKLG